MRWKKHLHSSAKAEPPFVLTVSVFWKRKIFFIHLGNLYNIWFSTFLHFAWLAKKIRRIKLEERQGIWTTLFFDRQRFFVQILVPDFGKLFRPWLLHSQIFFIPSHGFPVSMLFFWKLFVVRRKLTLIIMSELSHECNAVKRKTHGNCKKNVLVPKKFPYGKINGGTFSQIDVHAFNKVQIARGQKEALSNILAPLWTNLANTSIFSANQEKR